MLSALSNFAQDYTYYTYSSPTDVSSGGGVFMIVYVIFMLIIGVVIVASLWRIFKKAGQPGWAAIVPVYNYLIILKIVGRPWWWILLVLIAAIPIVGWIVGTIASVIILNDLSKSFRKDVGMTVALFFVIGFPILAFGDAKYHGPAALNTPGELTGPAASHGGSAHPQA